MTRDQDNILAYAEYLSRIRSIAISIQLPEKCIAKKLTFNDVRTGVLHYEKTIANNSDDSESANFMNYIIRFPEDITIRVSESTYPISESSSSISVRLPASPELADVLQSKLTFYDNSNLIPWPADKLGLYHLDVCCVQCHHIITDSTHIKQWKALPSENWAEMMDFWHCHKPTDSENTSFNPSYAVSKFVPYSGTGLVGDCYFYITKADTSVRIIDNKVECENCGYDLGTSDEKNELSLTIWKWNLKIIDKKNEKLPLSLPTTYPLHLYVSTVISRLIDSHAIYTFSIADMKETPNLLLWVFNPDIKYTTESSISIQRGFKIVYCYDKKIMPTLEKTRGEIELVKFPGRVLEVLKTHILQNTQSLPENARKFGQWKVSMLEKIN